MLVLLLLKMLIISLKSNKFFQFFFSTEVFRISIHSGGFNERYQSLAWTRMSMDMNRYFDMDPQVMHMDTQIMDMDVYERTWTNMDTVHWTVKKPVRARL